MKSLNPTKSQDRYTDLIVRFKRWYNRMNKDKLFIFNSNLYGKDIEFKVWLYLKQGIKDLDLHLDNLETNTKLSYSGKSIRYYNIVNR